MVTFMDNTFPLHSLDNTMHVGTTPSTFATWSNMSGGLACMHVVSLLGPLCIRPAEDYARIRCGHVTRVKFNEFGMTVGLHSHPLSR